MSTKEILSKLDPAALAELGQRHIAYVKPIEVDGTRIYEVHAANGEALARFADREVALVTCRQNELEPVSVH